MKCAHCGVEFDTNRSDQKYCSVKCRRSQERVVARGNRQLAAATCHICGKEFVTLNGNEKYCSDDCFNAHMKKIQAMALAREKAQALNNKAVSRPTKNLDDWAREAYQCGLDYGTYRALIGQGKTFEELKTQYEQRRAGI